MRRTADMAAYKHYPNRQALPDAALRQAQTMGARPFILYGTSMGGQIVGQFLGRSPAREPGRPGHHGRHLPAFLAGLAGQVTEWRTGINTGHPIKEAHDLVAAGRRLGWEIQFEPFAQGEHTEAWNVDRARYDQLVNRFLSQNAP